MKSFLRVVGMCFLLALFIAPLGLQGQDIPTINVVGSGIANRLFDALRTSSGVQADVTVNVTGTDEGFATFCQNGADITTATRPLSAQEEANCTANNAQYTEYLLGHNVAVFITYPQLTFVDCLDTTVIDRIFAPSATGQATDWTQLPITIDPSTPATPLVVFVPQEAAVTSPILDRLVTGVGLREDATVLADDSAVIAAVNSTPGAIGVVSLNAAAAAGARILNLSTDSGFNCYTPSAETVEARQYAAADRLLLYVNQSSLEKPGLRDLLAYAVNPDSAAVVTSAGFTPPSERAYERNQTALTGQETGRQFTQDVTEFQIPPTISGTITIAGAGHLYEFISSVTSQFTTAFPSVTTTVTINGEPDGVLKLCNGEIDMITADGPLSAEQETNCNANLIYPVQVDLGRMAVVLVANADSQYRTDYMQCFTPDQLRTIWGAPSSETVLNWSDVDASFPQVPMTLFSPTEGTSYIDLLLRAPEGPVIPIRDGIEFDDDPLYRAAATANVEGALALMSWDEYQRVLENNQERIQLVAVNAGNGCVTPSLDTIIDGSYPLTGSAALLVRQDVVLRPEVQSFLWYIFMDDNYSLLQNAGLIGIAQDELVDRRQDLQDMFARLASASVTTVPEATSEVTPEATAEATSSAETTPSVETTPEGTPEATPGT